MTGPLGLAGGIRVQGPRPAPQAPTLALPPDPTLAPLADLAAPLTSPAGGALKPTGTPGTYGQVTTDAQGRVTAGATCDPAHGGTGQTTLTAHAVLVGAGAGGVATAGPSTFTGLPLISQGSSLDPIFGVAGVGGGGTGLSTLPAHGLLVGNGGLTPNFATPGVAGTLLVSQGASADPSFQVVTGDATLTSAGALTLAAGVVTLAKEGSSARPVYNYLINGGMILAQRQAPGTLTTVASDKYAADRWRVPSQTASVQYIRVDTAGALETGITARYYGTLKQITAAGKLMVCQILEAVQTLPLASRTVTFQLKLKASSSKTLRLGLIQLTSAGTPDTIPAAVVPTTWGAGGTDPTLGTNLAYLTTGLAVPTGASGSVSGNGVTCLVTTAWTLYGVSVTLPSNANNLLVAVWTDSQFAALDTLSLTEAGLYDGGSIRDWLPRHAALEQGLAERFFEKTYPIDTAPGTTASSVFPGALASNADSAGATAGVLCPWRFRAPKRASPTVLSYNPAVAADSGFRDGGNTATLGASSTGIGTNGVIYFNTTAGLDGTGYYIQGTAESEL